MHTTVTKDDGTRLIVEINSEASVTIAWEIDDEWRDSGTCPICGTRFQVDSVPSEDHHPVCPQCATRLTPAPE